MTKMRTFIHIFLFLYIFLIWNFIHFYCIYVYNMSASCLWRPEESITSDPELLRGFWELKQGPLPETGSSLTCWIPASVFNFFILLVYLMSVVCLCEVKAMEPMWRSEDNSRELDLFHNVGPRDWTQAVKLDGSTFIPWIILQPLRGLLVRHPGYSSAPLGWDIGHDIAFTGSTGCDSFFLF